MTQEEVDGFQIRRLKASGLTYQEIANVVNLPLEKVKEVLKDEYSKFDKESIKFETYDAYTESIRDIATLISRISKKLKESEKTEKIKELRETAKLIMDATKLKSELLEKRASVILISRRTDIPLITPEELKKIDLTKAKTTQDKLLEIFRVMGVLDNIDVVNQKTKEVIAETLNISIYTINDVIHRIKYHRLGEDYKAKNLKSF